MPSAAAVAARLFAKLGSNWLELEPPFFEIWKEPQEGSGRGFTKPLDGFLLFYRPWAQSFLPILAEAGYVHNIPARCILVQSCSRLLGSLRPRDCAARVLAQTQGWPLICFDVLVGLCG